MSLIVSAYARWVARDYDLVRADRGAREFVLKRDRRGRWPSDCAAFSIGRCIYWPNRRAMRSVRLLRHELSHVDDHRRLGGVPYAVAYWVADAVWGHTHNPFEKKALAAERRRSR